MADRVRHKRFRRVRTPSVLQMEATECGAASLAIILAYYGRHVPLEELRVECRVSRDGSNALYVKKTAEKYGLSGKGYQMTTEELRGLRPPFMVFWEMNHFLVVEGLGRDRVYLNDPASGRRTVSLEEFTESYAGIVFRFEPAPGFRKGGAKPSTWRAIARRMARRLHRGRVRRPGGRGADGRRARHGDVQPAVRRPDPGRRAAAMDPTALAGHGADAAFPALDRVHPARRTAAAEAVAGGDALGAVCLARPAAADSLLPAALRRRYRQPGRRQLGRGRPGLRAARDHARRPARWSSSMARVMFAFDPVLAAVGVVFGALNMAGIAAAQRVLADENIKVKHFGGLLAGSMMHAVQIIETIKAGASEHEALVRLTGNQARLTNASQRVTTVAGLLVVLPPFLSLVTTAAVLGLGGGHVIDGLMSVGALVAFQALLTQFNRPFGDLVGLGSSVQTLQAELARLDDVEQHRIDPVFDPRPAAPAAVTGSTGPDRP